MAREEIFFGINIDTGQTIKKFGDLKAQTKKLKQELDRTKVGTKRFNELKEAITKNQATIRRFNRQLRDTKSLATRVGQGMTNAFKGVGAAMAGAFAAKAIFDFFKNASKKLADFEQQMAKVKAVTGATEFGMKQLTKSAKELGASSQFTASQVGELQEEFAKLGFSTQEILDATEATLDLATATQSDLSQAATVAAATVKGFGLQADETQRVVDVMAKSFSSSALDISKFQTAMATVAPVAKSAGVGLEETTAILGRLTDRGIDASTAGTALRNMYLKLAEKGLTWNEALSKIQNATDKNATALELFGTRGATVATIIAENTENINEFTTSLEEAEGAAKEMAKTVGTTLQGDMKRLESAWEGLVLSFQDGNNIIKDTVQAATDLLNTLTKEREIINTVEAFGLFKDELFSIVDVVEAVEETNEDLLSDRQKTVRNLFNLDKQLTEQINELVKTQNKEGLKEFARNNLEIVKEIRKTNKAAGDATGEQYDAFAKAYSSSIIAAMSELKKLNEASNEELDESLGNIQDKFDIQIDPRKAVDPLKDVKRILKEIGEVTDTNITGDLDEALNKIGGQVTQLKPKIKETNDELLVMLTTFEEITLALNGLSFGLAEASVGFAELAQQQAEGSAKQQKLAKISIRLGQAELAINRAVALSEAFKGIGKDIGKGFPTNLIAVASTLGLIVSTFASFKALSAPVKFQRGGVIQGKSHAEGGVPVKLANGGMVEAEGGEVIINKKSSALFSKELSAINSYGGYGDKFERGGLLGAPSTSPVGDTTNAQLLGALNNINFQPTVSVIEINEAQTRINEVNTSSQL